MEIADTLVWAERVQGIIASKPHYTDDLWMVGLLACTFVLAAVFSDRKRYFAHLLREFFLPRERAVEGTRTTSVVYMRAGLYLVAFSSLSLLLSICASSLSEVAQGHAALWLWAGGGVAAFYLLKLLLFAATNRIFFDYSTTATWEQNYAGWTILSAIPLYLLCGVALFFNLPSHTILLLLGIVGGLLEICLFYKAFHIFSAKKHGILQIFVYLCTLELMPLLAAAKALVLFV